MNIVFCVNLFQITLKPSGPIFFSLFSHNVQDRLKFYILLAFKTSMHNNLKFRVTHRLSYI